jgi:hydrogenase nickel incorporation protein HypA/HybF
MHEFALAESTLEIALAQARKQGATRIHRLGMRIGALAGVVPEAFEFALTTVTEGSIAEGAALSIEHVPLTCYCSVCDREFEAEGFSYLCPTCHGLSGDIRKGREMDLVSIEVS